MTDTAKTEAIPASACPVAADIGAELFEPGSQEHWFDSYKVLHEEAPIARIPGKGWLPGADAFVVSKFEDIAAITRDPRFWRPRSAASSTAMAPATSSPRRSSARTPPSSSTSTATSSPRSTRSGRTRRRT